MTTGILTPRCYEAVTGEFTMSFASFLIPCEKANLRNPSLFYMLTTINYL